MSYFSKNDGNCGTMKSKDERVTLRLEKNDLEEIEIGRAHV